MSNHSKIYLETPTEIEAIDFQGKCEKLLKIIDIASIKIKTVDMKHDVLVDMIELVKKITKNYKTPILIEENLGMAKYYKLDGIHLTGGTNSIKKCREELGPSAIIGTFCGCSKHVGLVAAEKGANYVSFSATVQNKITNTLNIELFKWWQTYIEIPSVVESIPNNKIYGKLSKHADYIMFSSKIWTSSIDTIIKNLKTT